MSNERITTEKFPSVKGYNVESTVTVPITNAVEVALDTIHYQQTQSTKADVETFIESSTLSNTAAKNLAKRLNYPKVITSANHWRDPSTGRIILFEKQGVPTRLM